MLKRPSSRRKGHNEQVNLNLVPILDTMVTLIGFLLFTMSFLSLVSIESPFPESSSQINEQKNKEKPLQLTLSMHEKDVSIWSPFQKVQSQTIPNTPEGAPDMKKIHDALFAIKQKFVGETKIVFAPTKGASYEVMIALMDAIRLLEPTDPPLFVPNPQTGVDTPVKQLFPEVVFGNLLSTN